MPPPSHPARTAHSNCALLWPVGHAAQNTRRPRHPDSSRSAPRGALGREQAARFGLRMRALAALAHTAGRVRLAASAAGRGAKKQTTATRA